MINYYFLRQLVFGSLLFLSYSMLNAASIYDGTSTLCIQSTEAMPINGTSAIGLVWFQQGFQVPSSGVFTLDIVLPVNQTIDLNSGILALENDLVLASDVTLEDSSGDGVTAVINGGGYTMKMSNDLTYSGSNQELVIGSDLIIDGQGHTFTLGGSNYIAIGSGITLTLKNMTFIVSTETFSTNVPFSLTDNTSNLILENVRLVSPNNFFFTSGNLSINDTCSFTGSPNGYVFCFESSGNLTINSNSELHLDFGVTLKHAYPDADNIIFIDASSRLRMTGSTLESAARTLTLDTGTLITDHASYLLGSGDSGNLNLGNSDNPLTVIFLPAATFNASGNTITYANPE